VEKDEQKKLIAAIIADTDPFFLKWAMTPFLSVERDQHPPQCKTHSWHGG
jgi:hypothetical protein